MIGQNKPDVEKSLFLTGEVICIQECTSYCTIKVVLIRLGIYLFVNKARGGGRPKFLLILCDVTTISSETQIISNQGK